uniref:Uncharacterized protein n=1 Tax=Opuntia streptacantha TaxID=393608 RepID=A0A7C9DZ56_OPUST
MMERRPSSAPGRFAFASTKFAVRASFLPKGTSQYGPPTRMTASLAAIARISAQETTPGHSDSTIILILSIILNPLNEWLFWAAFFSLFSVMVSSKRTDPSHP